MPTPILTPEMAGTPLFTEPVNEFVQPPPPHTTADRQASGASPTDLDLWLDHYDDIYSDFDSRHYLKRRISDDFLNELKAAFRHRDIVLNNLVLMVPAEKRQEDTEKQIIDNLSHYFLRGYDLHHTRFKRKRTAGFLFLLAGMVLMVANAFISQYAQKSFTLTALRVLAEPAGWFMIWTAIETLFYDLREIKKDRMFYMQMSEARIRFKTA